MINKITYELVENKPLPDGKYTMTTSTIFEREPVGSDVHIFIPRQGEYVEIKFQGVVYEVINVLYNIEDFGCGVRVMLKELKTTGFFKSKQA